jgi:hypothetical protein
MSSPASASGARACASKRDISKIVKSEEDEMAVDAQAPEDLGCAASLIGYGALPDGDRALLTSPYPTNDREPQAVQLDEAAQAAIAAAGSGKEVTDPLDYAPESHEVCANARFAISTNESARAELGLQEELKNALYDQATMKPGDPGASEAQQRVVSAKRTLETTLQSSELRPDKVTLTFDPTAMEWRFAYYFTNPTGHTASVACELPRLEGTTLSDSRVSIDGYDDKSKYEPIKKAKEAFDTINRSNNYGACLQAVSKQVYTQTVKIPAWKGGDGPQVAATFSAHFVLSCDDVDRKSLLLPKRNGEPTFECSDFAVQPPANDVPFELKINQVAKYGAKLSLPSRAAAKLDAERRGEPTYWIQPTGDEPCRIELTTPALQPPCLRFRVLTESDADFDFLTDAVGDAQIAKAEADRNKLPRTTMLCWAPVEDGAGIALVEVTAPKTLPDLKNAPGKTIHIVWVVDLSGSMGMRQGSSPHTNRHLACQEVKLACEKMRALPKQFVEAGVASPNDRFIATLVGFHCSAFTVCARVPVVTGDPASKAAIDKAVDDLCTNQQSGGTRYTSWAQLVKTHCEPTDHVALGLLTDGALWDEDTFVPAYAELKKGVAEFTAFAIGCGAWANHRTVKLVATHGETLIEAIDRSVSSAAMKGIARCVASMSVKIPIVIAGQVLSHKGDKSLPAFSINSKNPHGVDSVYELGLGEKRVFTVVAPNFSGAGCNGIVTEQIGQSGEGYKIDVRNGGACAVDVKRVLRHLDPLFADSDIRTLKNPNHPKRVLELLEQVGVVNQCTTSQVTKIARYELGDKYDHTLHPGVKAVVPAFKPPNADAVPEWLQKLQAASSTSAKNGKTVYTNAPHYNRDDDGFGSWGDGFRSLGCSGDKSGPVYRSCAAGDDDGDDDDVDGLTQTAAPPARFNKPPGQKAEVDPPSDANGTPKFGAVATLVHAHALLPFLNDHTLAHRAVQRVIEELNTTRTHLKNANGAGGGGGAAGGGADDDLMGDVVEALVSRVAGPSPEDVATKIDALLQVLCSLVMRYRLPVDVNLHNAAIAEGDVSTALHRVEYLLKIAARLHEAVLPHKPDLWRAELKTEAVGPDNLTVKTSLDWVAEDNVRPSYDRVETDPKEVAYNACYSFACAFNEGAHKGGTFCSDTMLFSGPKPATFANKEFKLGAPLVLGTHLNPWSSLHEPFKPQLAAVM